MPNQDDLREIIYNTIQKASMLGSTFEDSAMTEENYKKSFELILSQAITAILSAGYVKRDEIKIDEQRGKPYLKKNFDIDQTLIQIKKELLKKLPKRIETEINRHLNYDHSQGFNQCLFEIQKIIEEIYK